jgi:peptide/nickel transport system substrate-binding protein
MHDLDKYPGEVAFTGDIAERWEIPDPSTWIFHLRQGMKFHNVPPVSGRTVRAADVVYSLNRQRDERLNAGTVRAITNTEAVNDSTIRFTLTQPDADFLWSISDYRTVIMPPESVESAGGDLQNGPVIGTGAWIWDQSGYVLNQISKMRRNPDFYIKAPDGQALPYAEGMEEVVIVDANLQVAAFRAGQADLMDTNGQTTELLRQSVPDLYVLDAKLLNQTGDRLWMDATVPPYKTRG